MFERLTNIDRRIIFILVTLSVIVPTLVPVSMPIPVSEPTQQLYDYIEAIPAGGTIMLAFDYGPSSLAELNPMARSIMKQCFAKDIRVIALTLYPEGTTMGSALIQEVVSETGAVDGEDYVFLGYRSGNQLVILGMGTEIASIFDTDYNGKPISEIPLMQNVINYDQIDLLVDLSSGQLTETWITYANGQFNLQIAAGVTGVIISQMYPYLQTGQLIGLIRGIAGAAEYECLIDAPAKGTLWINIESFVHLLIIGLVAIGNIAFFIQRGREE